MCFEYLLLIKKLSPKPFPQSTPMTHRTKYANIKQNIVSVHPGYVFKLKYLNTNKKHFKHKQHKHTNWNWGRSKLSAKH